MPANPKIAAMSHLMLSIAQQQYAEGYGGPRVADEPAKPTPKVIVAESETVEQKKRRRRRLAKRRSR